MTVGAAVTISNFPATQGISGTVSVRTDLDVNSSQPCVAVAFDSPAGVQRVGNTNGFPIRPMQDASGNSIPLAISGTVTIGSLPALVAGTAQIGSVTASISGTVPVSGTFFQATQPVSGTFWQATQPVSLASVPAHAVTLTSTTVTVSSMPAVSGSVTLGASTAQIGSVTASISGTVPVSGTFYQATQPVSLASLPALVAGTAQIGSVTASISNSVVTFYPMQGTTVTNSNFTSTTASTTLVSAVAGREVLTVFNEGAGNLHISPGATCTTIAYQVRLSAGDYWECPAGQLSLAHTAVFATSGTARVTEVS